MFLSFARIALVVGGVVGGVVAVPVVMQGAAVEPSPTMPGAPDPGAPDPGAVVIYQPPVTSDVVDAFRPPSSFAGAGNRGLEYDTSVGQAVVSSAAGTVVFAGRVGGSNHVTIQHADGLRTSYSQLDRVDVQRGDEVGDRQQVGAAGADFHFGVRVGGTYLDPAALFNATTFTESRTAHLIPVE